MAMTQSADNTQAVHVLLESEREKMLGFVRRRAGHILDPEDVLHQSSARALTSVGQLRDPQQVRGWFYRILRNVMADELRKAGLAAFTDDDVDVDAQPFVEDENAAACRCALRLAKDLKPEYATILERVVIKDQSVSSLADELGLSSNNALVRLHRARRALREAVKKYCGVDTAEACLKCTCDEARCCAV